MYDDDEDETAEQAGPPGGFNKWSLAWDLVAFGRDLVEVADRFLGRLMTDVEMDAKRDNETKQFASSVYAGIESL